METPICDICADPQKDKFMYQLNCGHSFHYECIMKTFQCSRKNSAQPNKCPLCRQVHGLLPIVNGLNKPIRGIHYVYTSKEIPKLNNIPCSTILKSGNRKGEACGCKCMVGMNICKRHFQSGLKQKNKPAKKKAKIIVNKLGDDLEMVQVQQAIDATSNK